MIHPFRHSVKNRRAARGHFFHGLVHLILVLIGAPCLQAENIRLARWDMRTVPLDSSEKSTSDTERIQLAADVLNGMKPDVILLDHVRDWDTSTRLARALRPSDYRVLVCSAFRESKSAPAGEQQVAILSRRKAYFTWSESWQSPAGSQVPGGLSFAAIEAGSQRLGIFSIQIEDRLGTALSGARNYTNAALANACLQQWHDTLDSYKKWEANRLEAVIVSGSFSKEPASMSNALAKFSNEFLGAPLDRVMPVDPAKDYFSTRLPVNPNTLAGIVITRSPLTCDINLDPAIPAVATVVESGKLISENLPPQPLNNVAAAAHALVTHWWNRLKTWPREPLIGAAVFLSSLLFLVVWRSARRKRRLRVRPASSATLRLSNATLAGSSGTFVISSSSSGSTHDERHGASVQPLILIDSSARTETQPPAIRITQKATLEDQSLREQLGAWLKQKLVRRLMADRAELLDNQRQAALKVMAVDERLSRIEAHLRQQNQIYELRITELNRELLAARQENRALIHAKIVQVKAEMEAAKSRIMAQARDLR
jgi:hypothetical protein